MVVQCALKGSIFPLVIVNNVCCVPSHTNNRRRFLGLEVCMCVLPVVYSLAKRFLANLYKIVYYELSIYWYIKAQVTRPKPKNSKPGTSQRSYIEHHSWLSYLKHKPPISTLRLLLYLHSHCSEGHHYLKHAISSTYQVASNIQLAKIKIPTEYLVLLT